MSANSEVQTVTSPADKAKLAGAAVLALGGIVAYYWLTPQGIWVRIAALLVLMIAAVALFFTSDSGRQLVGFGRESVRETKKVVWPTRNEALQMTGYVFAFVVTMALFMWITDKLVEWVLYDLILRWRV